MSKLLFQSIQFNISAQFQRQKAVLFQTIQFSISTLFKCQKTVPSQTIQFSTSTQFSSIWSIDRTLSGQSGPGSDGYKGVLNIPQSSSITGTSSSDCLVLYPGHSFGWGSCPSAETQLVYSTALANRANGSHLWAT